MGFLDFFLFKDMNVENKSTLQKSIESHFPGKDDQTYINYTCIAGLLARVAFADLKVEAGEQEYMQTALAEWTDMNSQESAAVTEIAIKNVQNLVGLENHFYCSPLVEHYSEAERYNLIRVLFQLAASDGEIINIESEEIRAVNKYLRLTHQHYIAARAEVSKHLSINKM